MRKKWILLVGVLLMMGLLATAGSARAGGWATVTLSDLPKEVVAERPFTIEFSVRGHGQTLVAGVDAAVTAVHAVSGTRVHARQKMVLRKVFIPPRWPCQRRVNGAGKSPLTAEPTRCRRCW